MSQPPALGPLGLLRLGGFLVACVVGGIGLGYVLDLLAGTTPLFLFVGLALGIVSACAGSWRTVRDSLKQQ
jgi:F0F1-type ATP synthase assembly protein I